MFENVLYVWESMEYLHSRQKRLFQNKRKRKIYAFASKKQRVVLKLKLLHLSGTVRRVWFTKAKRSH